MIAIDTNVFVYMLDDDEPAKQAKARDLIDRLVQPPCETLLLWQVAGEFLNCLRRWESAGDITAADVEAHFRDVCAMFPLRIPTAKTLADTFGLRARFCLSHWDSMLLAACREAGILTLYSEDLGAGTDYDGVQVVIRLLNARARWGLLA